MIAGQLLETKLFAPRLRPGLVARPRLSDRLGRLATSKLTLVSAPAGFGKTTLLAEWLATAPPGRQSVAWLALDEGDSEPVQFWTYLIAALQAVVPGAGARALVGLQGPQPAPLESVLATLLNDVSVVSPDIVLVLDDYHLVDAPEIHQGMTFLLEHLPPGVHLVIATRADPPLPLGRLRGRGELTEIRAADLRFTLAETDAYLDDVLGLGLSARDVAALEGRTEGWIAALQLAGLSLQGRDDATGFIAGFAGDDRYIVDYLVEEVLHGQPEQVRDFLLDTSILARFTGPLCDAVTGQEGGKATLEALDRRNLFLVPLDDRRQWYRYHHLFADVLRARLLDDRPDRVPELHRRACEWYERNGDRYEAIHHAMAGGDVGRAADLVELAIPATSQARREAMLRSWLEALPDEVFHVRPVLSDAYAGSLLVRGEVEGVEARLRDAERWLDVTGASGDAPATESSEMVVIDEAAFRRLPGSIAVHRAGHARMLGDLAGTIAHARRALELVAEDDHLGQGGGAALLALAYWTTGDLEAASRSFAAGMASLDRAGHFSDVIGCTLSLADIRLAQGRLREAQRTYDRGLLLANSQDGPALRGAADMHVGISGILLERNDLEGAVEQLRLGGVLGEENGLPQNRYRSRVATALIRQAQGDVAGALESLTEAERLYFNDFSPDVRPVGALKARVWIADGRLPEARDWARDQGVTAGDELGYVREFEHTTLARLLLAQGIHDHAEHVTREATELLERLLAAAIAGERNGSVVELLALLSLARYGQDDVASALGLLERAMALAEPEGYVRMFIGEGPRMAALLKLAAKQPGASGYVRQLLGAGAGAEAHVSSREQALVEPLSERELEVLRLLEGDLDGPGMARELSVSLATVRTHTRNIYAKLGVNSRRAAVRQAAQLGLLSRRRDRRTAE